MSDRTCPGTGVRVEPTVAPERARDLRTGRAPCPTCHRTLSLTRAGKMRWHVASLAGIDTTQQGG